MGDEPRYPNITVTVVGKNRNAMVIIARTRQAMKRGGVPSSEIEEFTRDAMSGDYDHLLQTAHAWVNLE